MAENVAYIHYMKQLQRTSRYVPQWLTKILPDLNNILLNKKYQKNFSFQALGQKYNHTPIPPIISHTLS